ncbi:hypothetical protein [Leptospira koniambonensis]|uniref:hypothetical protein n=1 Tax=Leptospira koniambonensis TaxID=2484950 RepID=UPI003EBB869A
MKRNKKPVRNCYWCGDVATGKEHVPPKGLFNDLGNSNLKTVPSCKKHNEDFKLIDERFRFYLQCVSDTEYSMANFESTVNKIILDPQKAKFSESLKHSSKFEMVNGEERLVYDIDSNQQQKYFEKIIRGLYYLNQGKIIPEDMKVVSFSEQFISPNFDHKKHIATLEDMLPASKLLPGDFENYYIFRYSYYCFSDSFYVSMVFYNFTVVKGLVFNLTKSDNQN